MLFFGRPHRSALLVLFTQELRWTILLTFSCFTAVAACMTTDHIQSLRKDTIDVFYHGYENYMNHAFPEDELRPLTCSSLFRDRANPAHIEVNDVLGNYSLTLIDSLSTLAILASTPPEGDIENRSLKEFQNGIALLVEYYGDGTNSSSGQGKRARGFDLDSKVQVFETTIRGVGGLLSAHLFAVGELPIRGYDPEFEERDGVSGIQWPNGLFYDGQLLRLAYDLGQRLLPAFHTPTGLPYPRVNLRHGIPFYANSPLNTDAEHGQCESNPKGEPEITETCSAGAGSLVLEFTTLSRLTGDERFEDAGKLAFWAVWDRRSSAGLIGSGIDSETGQWVSPYTGIGAGIDSFFEYALKSHVLLSGSTFEAERANFDSPDAFLETWHDAHDGIKRHVYRGAMHQHPHYIQVDLYTGAMRAFWIDSLSAYYPGLLTLAGELDEAIETHLLYAALWTRYSALPERWSTATGNIESGLRWWGGRPEFIESTWYLYRATSDPFYLHVGEMTLKDIMRRCRTECGWAGLQDVRTGELSDRMESFFLGETAKYLFLLFDPTHPLNKLDAPFVFTTEGHPLIIPKHLRKRHNKGPAGGARQTVHHGGVLGGTCQVPPAPLPFTVSSTAARADLFHAASLARLHHLPNPNFEVPPFEGNVDHGSVTISGVYSPSNHTFYPWTLPMDLVPTNATSSKMAVRTTFDLSFPTLPETVVNFGAIQRVESGIKINSMSGLRLGMVMEEHRERIGQEIASTNEFRIYAVSNVPLGRDEKVFMPRDLASSFNPVDPYFTRIRDMVGVDILIDASPTPLENVLADDDLFRELDGNLTKYTSVLDSFEGADTLEFEIIDEDAPSDKLSSLISNIQKFLTSPTPPSSHQTKHPFIHRHKLYAALPIGPGAAPLPDVEDSGTTGGKNSQLPWSKVYITGDLCNERLAPSVPRDHQIIVIKRGGCSFSQKLQNIPAFAPSPVSLQLAIVVSFPEEEHDTQHTQDGQPTKEGTSKSTDPPAAGSGATAAEQGQKEPADSPQLLIQPLLDTHQFTPSGLPRPHPIPLVMVDGGERTMRLFRRAQGVGIRRHWHYMSQGMRIQNLVVL